MRYITSVERVGIQKGLQQGLQQGLEEGVQKGERRMLNRLLKYRFGSLPASYKRRLQEANTQKLQAWSKSLLNAKTLEEVFKTS